MLRVFSITFALMFAICFTDLAMLGGGPLCTLAATLSIFAFALHFKN